MMSGLRHATYPQMLYNRYRLLCSCVAMLADLYHAEGVCGTGTVGSSEAILLAGLAMKRRWSEKRKAAGKPLAQANMVCGSEVHVSISTLDSSAGSLPLWKKRVRCWADTEGIKTS
jgi:glutamate/tyrosine decarboxylase-like PLP-dependent enzyme